MAKLYITPLFRAVWHEMLARADIPPIAVRVGIVIGTHFDNNTGETYVGQATIARELKISERNAWTGVKALKGSGLLVVKHGGRATNHYVMPVEKVAAECKLYIQKYRSRVRTLQAERSQNSVEKVAAECEQTLTSTSLRDSTGGRWSAEPGSPEFESWLSRYTDQGARNAKRYMLECRQNGTPAVVPSRWPPGHKQESSDRSVLAPVERLRQRIRGGGQT